MKYKSKSANSNTTRPNLERFKYEVAQEMGLSFRNKKTNQNEGTETKAKGYENGKTF